MAIRQPQCAVCPYEWSERFCRQDQGKSPANCPSILHQDLVTESLDAIGSGEVREFARQASIQEAEGYCDREKGYGELPSTVLAVKDRLLGHNPLAAVYQYESYYRYLKQPLE
jgi:hypothetical protein